jgi:hypothetical protein
MYCVIKCVKTKHVLKGNFASSVFHSCNAKTQKTQICVTGPQCVNIFLFKYQLLLHILRFFFFSDNIIAYVASKQQTTALFLPTHTRRHTELKKKTKNPDGKHVLSQRTFSSVFRAAFFTQLNCTV